MQFSFNGFIYRSLIDPMLSGIRRSIVDHIRPEDHVLDVACGTGALAVAIAGHASHVTGIDLSEDMIITARRRAVRRKLNNVSFELLDATDLSCYPDNRFDVAVSTLAMHQFEPEVAVKVLSEMKRTARRVIVADYNCPMTPGPAAWLSWGIERAAKGDHYRNFRKYMDRRGAGRLFEEAGLSLESTEVRGSGVFVIVTGRAG